MIRGWQTLVAVLVILCVVGISGVASAQSVLHENQHSHHQASGHTWVGLLRMVLCGRSDARCNGCSRCSPCNIAWDARPAVVLLPL